MQSKLASLIAHAKKIYVSFTVSSPSWFLPVYSLGHYPSAPPSGLARLAPPYRVRRRGSCLEIVGWWRSESPSRCGPLGYHAGSSAPSWRRLRDLELPRRTEDGVGFSGGPSPGPANSPRSRERKEEAASSGSGNGFLFTRSGCRDRTIWLPPEIACIFKLENFIKTVSKR